MSESTSARASQTKVTVRAVRSKRDLRRFIGFPYHLYRDSPFYVPPPRFDVWNTFRPEKNAAFHFCKTRFWIALSGDRVVGRIAGIINERYIERWGNRYARFGWIEFVDDAAVSNALLSACEEWARGEGMTGLHGPLGFTDLDEEGMLIDGFDEMGTMPMIYNYDYYPRHIERYGFSKDVDSLEYEIIVPEVLPEKIRRISELVKARTNLTVVRLYHRRDALRYAKEIFQVLNASYAQLYGVTELDDRQIAVYIKQYFGFIHKDLIKIVVNENEEVVAFTIGFPSLSAAMRKAWGRLLPFGAFYLFRALLNPTMIELYLVAVRPDYQGRGVNSLLVSEMFLSCRRLGIGLAQASAQLEDNRLVRAFWRYFDFRQHKRRRIYLKAIE